MDTDHAPARVPIRQLVLYFLRLGLLGFGGPVARGADGAGARRRSEVGDARRDAGGHRRLSVPARPAGHPRRHLALLHPRRILGRLGRRGWAFILPNFVIVAALAALYVHFGGLSAV